MIELNKTYCGHNLDLLAEIPDKTVHCIITSPPYWGLRDFKGHPQIWGGDKHCKHRFDIAIMKKGISVGVWHTDKEAKTDNTFRPVADSTSYLCSKCDAWLGQLGLEPTIKFYIEHLMLVMDECWRILRKDGTLWVNLGDTYYGSYKGGSKKNRYNGEMQGSTFLSREAKPKSLCAVPARFQIAMIDAGWINRNKAIWEKPNCMPRSAKDRFTDNYEEIFYFTKSRKNYFKQILEKSIYAEDDYRSRIPGGKRHASGKYRDNSYDRLGVSYTNGKYRNKRCVWRINTVELEAAHFATFPPKLVNICLEAGCPEGGIVVDPFGGSGTVGQVAVKRNVNYILMDLNPEYCEISMDRTAQTAMKL